MPPQQNYLPQYNPGYHPSMVPTQYIPDTSDPIGRSLNTAFAAYSQGLGMIMRDKQTRAALQYQAQKDDRDYALQVAQHQLKVYEATGRAREEVGGAISESIVGGRPQTPGMLSQGVTPGTSERTIPPSPQTVLPIGAAEAYRTRGLPGLSDYANIGNWGDTPPPSSQTDLPSLSTSGGAGLGVAKNQHEPGSPIVQSEIGQKVVQPEIDQKVVQPVDDGEWSDSKQKYVKENSIWTQTTGNASQGEGGFWYGENGKVWTIDQGQGKQFHREVDVTFKKGMKFIGDLFVGNVPGPEMFERFANNVAEELEGLKRRRWGPNLSKEAINYTLMKNIFSEASRASSRISPSQFEAMIDDGLRKGRKDHGVDEIDADDARNLRRLYPKTREQAQQMHKAMNDVENDVHTKLNSGGYFVENIKADEAHKSIVRIANTHGLDVQDVLTMYNIAGVVIGNESQQTWWGNEYDPEAVTRSFKPTLEGVSTGEQVQGPEQYRDSSTRAAWKTAGDWIGMGTGSQLPQTLFRMYREKEGSPSDFPPSLNIFSNDPNSPSKYQGTGFGKPDYEQAQGTW